MESRLAPASFQTLYNFTNGTDGKLPESGVTPDSSGNLYGATRGQSLGGVLFELSSKGVFTTLQVLDGGSLSAPLLDGNGNLFGTTLTSSKYLDGTVFEFNLASKTYTTIHAFDGSDGGTPENSLIVDSKGNLYGTTYLGGPTNNGSVYELSPNGSGGYNYDTLYQFTGGDDGGRPNSSLILDGQGNLYGVAQLAGGANGEGTVFRLSPNGSGGYDFTNLHTFTGSDGGWPDSTLIMDAKGNLYGATVEGGSSNNGTLFELSPNGSGGYHLTTLYNFDSVPDGSEPGGNWLMDDKGNFYGTTAHDGAANDGLNGTVFEFSPNGSGGYSLTTLHSFDDSDGSGPHGLSVDSSGNLFGATGAGGTDGDGTIFELSGAYHVVAPTQTAASNTSTPFSTNKQSATLTADVTSSAGPVNEGTVTFTVAQGSTIVGSATTSDTVSNGAASVSYALPAGLTAGTYSIDAVYSGGPDLQGSSDDTHTLTVTPANATTNAGNVTAYYSPKQQTVTLNATLADGSFPKDTVDEGTVTFTVMDGGTSLGSVSGTVKSGTASANFAVAAGQALGSYTIDVSYDDSAGNFLDNGDNSAILTIGPANITPTANNVSAVYSPNKQTLTLGASVADTSIATDTVNEGTVTFALKSGSTILGTAQGTVSSGEASASFSLPAGQDAGTYTIAVSYSDSTGNFTDSGDTNATLAIAPANVTATAQNATVAIPNVQTVTLNASVADTSVPIDTVDEGTVTFTVKNGSTTIGSVSGTVIGGTASATFSLPAGLAPGSYALAVSYSDNQGNFTDSGDGNATLTVLLVPTVTTNPINQAVTVGATATFTAAANGDPTPTVQWQVRTNGATTWTDISGATTTTLTLNKVPFSLNGNEYRAVFTNSEGAALTTAAMLTFQTPPTITSGNNATFTIGQGGSFTWTATGSPTPTFTESGALPGGITFMDNGNGTATLSGVPAAGTQGTYHSTITAHNGVGSDFTQSFALMVNPAPAPPPRQPPVLNVPPLLALFDSLLGVTETINANGTETVVDSLFGTALVVATYDGSGNIVSATLFGINVPNFIWFL